MNVRKQALVAIAMLVSVSVYGQALAPDFVHGVDYTFERMTATRKVRDAFDQGTIRLVTLVYRPPAKVDRHEVVLFSHGSTGGAIRSPKEPWQGPPVSVIRYFTSRGYTVVAPMRRGRGESSGTYVEECAIYAGECTLVQQTGMLDQGVREATLDTLAVIDQVVFGRLVGRQSKILLVGVSRGGFLSLWVAAQRPQQVKGLVNFVGGWLSISDKYAVEDNSKRLALQVDRFAVAGRNGKCPSLSIYASRDQLYGESTTREFFRAYKEAGGHGEYVYVADHSLPNGHLVAATLSLWEGPVDKFLQGIDG